MISKMLKTRVVMIKIITDSTCDLSNELIQKYDIQVLPLYVNLGDESFRDKEDITVEQVYEWSDKHKTTPKTAAASIGEVMEVLEPYKEAGDDVIIFSISESMSSINQNMRLAAQELEYEDHIFVIDSMNLSTGIGLQIIEACEMAQKGMAASDIADYINNLRPKVRSSFVIDTLVYLARGGRCSSVAALIGGVLNIKPKIVVEDGKMIVAKKYRGPYKKVIKQYVKEMEADLLKARKDRVFITHTPCDDGIVDGVRSYLEELDYFDEILETNAGCTVGSHCGPNTLGVLFIAGDE